jgi:DNA-binding response OmpR family regulator
MALPGAGSSVFLVEDDVLIRMMVVEMLEELGHRIAAETGDLDHAERLARTVEYDVAILDVNLKGRSISSVADLISESGRPLIFVTGYGVAGLPAGYQDRPVLQKPFKLEELGAMIEFVVGSKSEPPVSPP